MILSGVPLNEPSLQYRLSHMANEERKGLKGGKLPITESFYLMGTADPTGVLNQDQVCVILYVFFINSPKSLNFLDDIVVIPITKQWT